MLSVTIVIVNYRTAHLTIDCLGSIFADPLGSTLRVIVTDNASPDDSVDAIARAIDANGWGDWVTLMPLERNGGFAYGNNRAIEHVLTTEVNTKYIMLLNPDTLVEPGAIGALVRFAEAHPEAGIVGSRLLGPDGQVQSAAKRFPSGLNSFESAARTGPISRLLKRYQISIPPRDEPHACDWVSGAAMLIRREVIDRIGLMDECYFLYFEEVDYCRRSRAADFEIWHEPASAVTHLEGAATQITQPKRRPRWWFDSRRRFLVKSYGVFGLIWVDLCWMAGRSVFGLRQLLCFRRREQRDPPRFTSDLILGDLWAILTGRAWQLLRPVKATR